MKLKDRLERAFDLHNTPVNTRLTHLRCIAKFEQHHGKPASRLGRQHAEDFLLHFAQRLAAPCRYRASAQSNGTIEQLRPSWHGHLPPGSGAIAQSPTTYVNFRTHWIARLRQNGRAA